MALQKILFCHTGAAERTSHLFFAAPCRAWIKFYLDSFALPGFSHYFFIPREKFTLQLLIFPNVGLILLIAISIATFFGLYGCIFIPVNPQSTWNGDRLLYSFLRKWLGPMSNWCFMHCHWLKTDPGSSDAVPIQWPSSRTRARRCQLFSSYECYALLFLQNGTRSKMNHPFEQEKALNLSRRNMSINLQQKGIIMKKYLAALAVSGCFCLAMAGQSQALIIEQVHLEFAAPGLTWDGTITFNDGYEGMIDTSGYLNGFIDTTDTLGYPLNFTNELYSWTWNTDVNPDNPTPQNPYDYNGDTFYEDWLMNGTDFYDYDLPIRLNWSAAASRSMNHLFLVFNPNHIFNGIDNQYLDNHGNTIVAYSSEPISAAPVPEPGTMLLFGTGLAGLLVFTRRKTKAE